LAQEPELAERFAAIAGGWGWASDDVRTLMLATLDAMAGQLAAGRHAGSSAGDSGKVGNEQRG
jgi:hypothetical protein